MLIAGVDEAGRGPLVGPVVASAVILPESYNFSVKLTDSKKISEKNRETLYEEITAQALDFSIIAVNSTTIDEINILQATMLAMQKAVLGLKLTPDKVMIDGNRAPDLAYDVETVIKGDSKIPAISAASILAKVHRDRIMLGLDKQYPAYKFRQHKGYPTKEHLELIKTLGVFDEYRKSFKPVAEILMCD